MHPTSLSPSGVSDLIQLFRIVTLAVAMLVLAATFSTPLQAQTYSTLYEFGGQTQDPENPQYSGLIAQGRDGDLYSTAPATPLGLCSFCGAVFKITPSGTVTVVYDFNDTAGSGYTPFGGLVLGNDGNFYGTTKAGGTVNQGTLFKITASGTLTPLYNFGTCTYPCKEGLYPKAPPVQGTDGNFYGTTPDTIDGTNSGVVYKITSAGKFTTIHAFDFAAGYNPNAPLIQGTDGNFYGTTTLGGKTVLPICVAASASPTCGTVFKINTAGKVTTLYKFGKTDGAGPLGPVIQGTDGNFYGTTSEGGTSGLGVVFKLTSAGVLTVLHDFNGADGQTPDAGLVQANDGNFYGVASAGGTLGFGTIFKITSTSDHTFSVLYNFDSTHGATPEVALMQHTNGILYGDTDSGDTHGGGVFYSLNIGAAEFAKLQTLSGKVGTQVSILGQGFIGSTAVSFGGVNATTFTVVSDTYVTANVPTGGKTGTVTVVRPSGSLNSIQQFKVTPTLGSFSPPSGPIGTSVTINGTGLIQTTKVTFGGVPATTFTVNSDSKITATVPSGAKTGKIVVTTPGGSATSSGTFSVTPTILSFSPPSGKVGTVVTINGTGLTQTTGVSFGGVAATAFTVVSDLRITATVPTGAITGKIAVTTAGGTATSSATFTVTP
jgi:uncharacterized repeat protein (TIGR03803 family)